MTALPFTGEVVVESSSPDTAASLPWWLNSGAYFFRHDGIGQTIQGDLPEDDPWRKRYAESNPRDTADGRRPQCLFRLLTLDDQWKDFDFSVDFRIRWLNRLDSPERDGWSGVLFMFRYIDGDNLYYAGIRHDGHIVTKRKRGGIYETLGSKQVHSGTYLRDTNPNLIPDGWHTLRVVAEGNDFMLQYNGIHALAFSDVSFDQGRIGIRSDFADVEFRNLVATAPSAERTLEERVEDLERRVEVLEAKG